MDTIGYRPRLSESDRLALQAHRQPNVKTWLVLFDLHVPFHDQIILSKILDLCSFLNHRIEGIIFGGDFLELYTLGSYNRDSLDKLRNITLSSEYAAGNEVLDLFDEALPTHIKKFFIYGNHEDRYKREVAKGDNGKYGTAFLSPTTALNLTARGYHVYENWLEDYVKLGRSLYVMHGLSCAKYCAAANLRDFRQGSIMTGHTHREQTFKEGSFESYSIGALCDIESPVFYYMPRLKRDLWNNGFALVHVDDQGSYYVDSITVNKTTKNFVALGTLF